MALSSVEIRSLLLSPVEFSLNKSPNVEMWIWCRTYLVPSAPSQPLSMCANTSKMWWKINLRFFSCAAFKVSPWERSLSATSSKMQFSPGTAVAHIHVWLCPVKSVCSPIQAGNKALRWKWCVKSLLDSTTPGSDYAFQLIQNTKSCHRMFSQFLSQL